MLRITASRLSIRRLPAATQRLYTTGGRSEGAVAESTGSFSEKEKAIENQWARLHDAEKIKVLREKLLKQEQETAQLKADIDALKKQ
ncbi:hypothetical protein BC936DRAFT_141118 [Jimgerdemannia flammicorona]|uniref:ATPase inhibitor, mitochondrial n=1 Tax=Jimgerdemannia flammicorona TaxID=994334 RepID=A0A433A2V5_9FUNG|nr:hypothetical protein BC936DRAFT_141118 [Jimgerdemannia flammicorona]